MFVALGGSSYAAVVLTRNSVKNRHIANNAVTSNKVKDGSLLSKDFKAGQLVAGAPGLPGAKGETGAPGAAGAPGATGEKGAAGAPGEKGDTGATGATGPKGDTGTTGPQGAKGDTGAKGDKGDTGNTGSTGPQGQQGLQGPQGTQGPQGPTGPAGPSGPKGWASLAPVTLPSSGVEHIRIVTSTFVVPAGVTSCMVTSSIQTQPPASAPNDTVYLRNAVSRNSVNADDAQYGPYLYNDGTGRKQPPLTRSSVFTVTAGQTVAFGVYFGGLSGTWFNSAYSPATSYFCS